MTALGWNPGGCCCFQGILDVYGYSLIPGQPSSRRYFSRVASTLPDSFPITGKEAEKQWGFERVGENATRHIMQSMVAWGRNVVYQIEDCSISFEHSFRQREKETSIPLNQHRYHLYDGDRKIDPHDGKYTVHFGGFEVLPTPPDDLTTNFKEHWPAMIGLKATEPNSLATFDLEKGTKLRYSLGIFFAEGFSSSEESVGAVLRYHDEENYIRVRLVCDPNPHYYLEEIVNGDVTVLDHEDLVPVESYPYTVFDPHPDMGDNWKDGSHYTSRYYQFLELRIVIGETQVKVEPYFQGWAQVWRPLQGTTSITGSKKFGFFSEGTELTTFSFVSVHGNQLGLNFLNSDAWSLDYGDNGPRIEYLNRYKISIYDDNVPTQIGELGTEELGIVEVDLSHVEMPSAEVDWVWGAYFVALVAGQSSALATATSIGVNESGSLTPHSSMREILEVEDSDDEGPKWIAVNRDINEYVPETEYYISQDHPHKFWSNDFILGKKAYPVFAQHCYPLCAGYLFDVEFEKEGDTWNVHIVHKLVMGQIEWPTAPELEGHPPYVKYVESEEEEENIGELLLEFHEDIEDLNFMITGSSPEEFDPTEDWVRSVVSLLGRGTNVVPALHHLPYLSEGDFESGEVLHFDKLHTDDPKNDGYFCTPIVTFDTHLDKKAIAITWNYVLSSVDGGETGVVILQPDPEVSRHLIPFNVWYNEGILANVYTHEFSAVVAPGGYVCLTDLSHTNQQLLDIIAEDEELSEMDFESAWGRVMKDVKRRLTIYGPRSESDESDSDSMEDEWIRFRDEVGTFQNPYSGNYAFLFEYDKLRPIAVSDRHFYVQTFSRSQPKAVEFAGHGNVPYFVISSYFATDEKEPAFEEVEGGYHVIQEQNLGVSNWIITLDGKVRVPALAKRLDGGLFEPFHMIDPSFWGGSVYYPSYTYARAYDCVKDSSLKYAPVYSVDDEEDMEFIMAYEGPMLELEEGMWPHPSKDLYLSGAYAGAKEFTVPEGTTQITVDCIGGSGGGARAFVPISDP